MDLHVAIGDRIHAALFDAIGRIHGIDDHAVANIDGRMAVPCNKISRLGIRCGHKRTGIFLTIGCSWQGNAELAVDILGETGAVKAGCR